MYKTFTKNLAESNRSIIFHRRKMFLLHIFLVLISFNMDATVGTLDKDNDGHPQVAEGTSSTDDSNVVHFIPPAGNHWSFLWKIEHDMLPQSHTHPGLPHSQSNCPYDRADPCYGIVLKKNVLMAPKVCFEDRYDDSLSIRITASAPAETKALTFTLGQVRSGMETIGHGAVLFTLPHGYAIELDHYPVASKDSLITRGMKVAGWLNMPFLKKQWFNPSLRHSEGFIVFRTGKKCQELHSAAKKYVADEIACMDGPPGSFPKILLGSASGFANRKKGAADSIQYVFVEIHDELAIMLSMDKMNPKITEYLKNR